MMHMSCARLRRDTSCTANLSKVIAGTGAYGAHRLVWSLFGDAKDTKRDFLFRTLDRSGQGFLIVSARPPRDDHGLWTIECKDYAPSLSVGDRLRFSLRANPTVARKTPGRKHSVHHDVVMDWVKQGKAGDGDGSTGPDPSDRDRVRIPGLAWLTAKGDACGFTVDAETCTVGGYMQHRLHRDPVGSSPIRLSSLDFDGTLTVTDVERFSQTLFTGIGRGRAFGFGLLLVRRA